MGLLLGLCDYGLFHSLVHQRLQGERERKVNEYRREDDQCERCGVKEQNGAGDEGHDAVNDRADDTLGDCFLDWLDGPETRDDIADMPFLEEIARQAEDMANEIARYLKTQQMPEKSQRPIS